MPAAQIATCASMHVSSRRQRWQTWGLCAWICGLPMAAAWTVSVSEQSFPYFATGAPLQRLTWDRGLLQQGVVSSYGVRVTDNRVRVLTSPRGAPATHEAPCLPVLGALCKVHGDALLQPLGIGNGSLIFPTDGLVRTNSHTTFKGCVSGAGRHVVDGFVYDVSACDAFDSVLDVVFPGNTVGITRVHFSTTLYGVVGLLTVFVIVIITQNLAADMVQTDGNNSKIEPVGAVYCAALGVALFLVSCVAPGILAGLGDDPKAPNDAIHPLLRNLFYPIYTLSDTYFFLIVFACIILQLGVVLLFGLSRFVYHEHWKNIFNTQRGPGIWANIWRRENLAREGNLHSVNFLVTCVLLSVISTHGTGETFLTAPLTFVLTFRGLFKLCKISQHKCKTDNSKQSGEDWIVELDKRNVETFIVAVDFCIVVASVLFGIIPLSITSIEAITFCAMLFLVAAALAIETSRDLTRGDM
jgi:hypothetical protein